MPDVVTSPGSARVRTGTGVATWEPPVVEAPSTVAPQHARVAAHTWTSVTIDTTGKQPVFNGFTTTEALRHRDRILVAGRDITWYRGTKTPLPRFGLVSPLLYDAGTLELPQVAACFETPGTGALAWLKEGAPVLVQRVAVEGAQAGKVIATDYRGVIIGFRSSGRALQVSLGGDAFGRAALRDKQPPIFRRRNDLGWWWWAALAGPDGLRRPFEQVGGVETGIKLYDTGGTTFAQHLNELGAKGVNLSGTQWTCTPYETGVNTGTYRVHRKNLETVQGTVYLDDARTVASLQADASERPNRIYGTGVTPRGERAKFGVYPVLAERQSVTFPNNDGRPIELFDVDADTDSGGGVTALLHRLSVTSYLAPDAFGGGYDADVYEAVKDLQTDAGLPPTGVVNQATWSALFDVDATGYSTRGSRVEPIVQTSAVRPVFRNGSGQVIGPNPDYDASVLPVDRSLDFGTGVTRAQMRAWARSELQGGGNISGNGRHWTGTIRFNTGALIAGEHVPGQPVGSLIQARQLRPGHNLWLPLFDGGTKVHVSGVDVTSETTVVVSVDTRARDTMTVWEVIARNQDNKRSPARSWIRDHRSSGMVKDGVAEFDEIGGTIAPTSLAAGWNVFPVVVGQEGTIARLRLTVTDPAREFVVAVFGRRLGPARLQQLVGNPLTQAGTEKWESESVRNTLEGSILLYIAGSDVQPGGYWPKRKAATGVAGGPLTGKFRDDAGFGYRTFDQSCVLWVAMYVTAAAKLAGGRIMWPQLEPGA